MQQQQRQRRNAADSGCVKGGQWLPPRACRDTATHSAAINACEKGRAWSRGAGLLFWRAGDCGERDTIKFNAAYSACEKALVWFREGVLLAAMAYLRAKRCNIMCDAVIELFGKRLWAMEPMALMECVRMLQDTISYSAALRARVLGGEWYRVVAADAAAVAAAAVAAAAAAADC